MGLKFMVSGVIILALMACFATPVFADDGDDPGLNVDIIVSGDNPDVNLLVDGANADVDLIVPSHDADINLETHSDVTVSTNPGQIYINGQHLSSFGMAGGYGDVQTQYAVWELKKAVAGLFEALNQIDSNLNLTAQGLAKVILFINNQNGTFEDVVELVKNHGDEIGGLVSSINAHDGRFVTVGDNTFALWQKVNALEGENAEQSLRIQELENTVKTLWWPLMGAGCMLLVILASTVILWRRLI